MSSIMKGIVDESEEVAVIYIDNKPSTKYAKKHEAERDAEFLRKKYPNKKIEIKHEVRETEAKKGADGKRCWKGKRYAGTENGKDKCIPVKNEAANPAQQAAIAVNMKKQGKKPKHIEEASGTPGGVEMFRTKDMVNTTMQQNLYRRELQAVKDAEKKAKRAAYRAANPREAVPMMHIGASSYQIPAIQAWKDNGDVGEAIKYAVNKFANKQSKEFKADLASDPNFKEAVINFFNVGADILAARNAAMAKRGGSVPDSDYRTKEQTEAGYNAINIINDVLLNHMKKHGVDKTGRRVPPGFNYTLGEGVIVGHDANDPEIAILGGAGTMSLSRLKKKAHQEALQLADDIANGKYNASSYNMKQLHNTLNTIVAAEKEMEQKYFGEARAPHPLLKAVNQNLIDLASGEVRRREEAKKKAAQAQKAASKELARLNKPKKPTLDQIWQKIEHAISNYFPDGDPTDYLAPYMERNNLSWDDITRAAKKNGYKDLWDYWNTLAQDIENDAYYDWHATGGKNVRQRAPFMETPTDNPTGASGEGGWRKYKPKSAGITESYPSNVKQYARDLASEMREEGYDWEPVDLSDPEEAIDDAREQLSMFASSNMCDFFGDYDTAEQLHIIKMFNKKFGGVKEDTAYAGGMGQGHGGESYRKFKPKSAGTFKESAIMKALKRESK